MICIGIDIAKRSHVASAVDEDGGTVVESFKFDNTANGFAKMLKRLRKADATPENSLVGMEATGRYWVALFDFLISHGYEAAVINPIQTDAFRGVWTVRKVKTDALDAAMIADLVRYKRYEPSALGDEATEELRNLARYRLSLVERSTALKNRATAILDRTFPELAGLFSNAYCPTRRELLQHCATPDQVLGTDVGTLERILREASRGRCGGAKAERLKALAKESVGVGFGSKTLAFEARLLMEELDFVQDQVKEVERELARLLERVGTAFALAPGTECTVEAGRPDTIDRAKLEVLKGHGVGRISINPQTLEDHVLRAIGRKHAAGDIRAANDLARSVGFDCINMDLIAGLPQDSCEGFRRSLEGVLEMEPENVTIHTLALKKGSTLMERGGSLPSGAEVAEMLDFSREILIRRGYRPYYLYRQKYMSGALENVGWAKPGTENLYNIIMMEELQTVVSVGGGGVTKLVDYAAGRIVRLPNPKYPHDYLTSLKKVLAQKEELIRFYGSELP